MTDKLLEYIKGKAEEKYFDFGYAETPENRKGYISGSLDTLELMIGFAEWINYNYWRIDNGNWSLLLLEESPEYTTSELLTKYIESLNK